MICDGALKRHQRKSNIFKANKSKAIYVTSRLMWVYFPIRSSTKRSSIKRGHLIELLGYIDAET
ncbi:hypothetical protein X975_01694, partial [Stegodyphus mimosarum]